MIISNIVGSGAGGEIDVAIVELDDAGAILQGFKGKAIRRKKALKKMTRMSLLMLQLKYLESQSLARHRLWQCAKKY